MPMQIRLTVLGPSRSGGPGTREGSGTTPATDRTPDGVAVTGRRAATGSARIAGQPAAACDVLVTAPEGTVLASVSHALVTCAAACGVGPGPGGSAEAVAVYADGRRLDVHAQRLGEPPLLDGAVLSLTAPAEATVPPPLDGALALLRVVAGPDAGGVHLLRGGRIRVGRAAEAEVRLDDPDVSRLHCLVTVDDSGQLAVADLGSTNGTTVDGVPVAQQPLALRPGSTLRLGESALRVEIAPAGRAPSDPGRLPPQERLPTLPDGQGRLLLAPRTATADGPGWGPAGEDAGEVRPVAPAAGDAPVAEAPSAPGGLPAPRRPVHPADPPGVAGPTRSVTGTLAGPAERLPGQRAERRPAVEHGRAPDPAPAAGAPHVPGPPPPSDVPEPAGETRRGRGIGAWARRFAGRPPVDTAVPGGAADAGAASHPPLPPDADPADARHPWPDLATVLLTALGPGPRLWERDLAHPEALTVRLGTVWSPQGTARPLTVGLRAVGSLGLAGPRPRLAGLARSVLAQLTALHAPDTLRLVVLAADPARPVAEREAEWSWAGWLPHLLPSRGQGCRLLFGFDADQATARLAELARRLDAGPLGPDWAAAEPAALRETAARSRAHPAGPAVLLVVDGDPGTDPLRAAVARLAAYGPAVGVHLLCLAETPAASPTSPTASTLRAARTASPGFAWCGAAALLSGAVATTVRVLHPEGRQTGTDTAATVDAVSPAWAERFARALAPLRVDGADPVPAAVAGPDGPPASCRLLEELGLARATPAALLARWAAGEQDGTGARGVTGRAAAVLGAGADGTVTADLAADRSHLFVTGGAGSGKTELLRSLAAALAAGERPDRLGLLLVDGGGARREGEGLRPCQELPHVSTYLAAGDPLRMREFAQALSGELKRRAELLGDRTFEEYARGTRRRGRPEREGARHAGDDREGAVVRRAAAAATAGGRAVGRLPGAAGGGVPAPAGPGPVAEQRRRAVADPGVARPEGAAPGAAGPAADTGALPRLVVLVDDFDTLVAPALGHPGRPAAGSVVRALEAVARDGVRLGVHVVAASGRPEQTAGTATGRLAATRVTLGAADGAERVAPGRGVLRRPNGEVREFQAGLVTGRIPRTATQRPTVVPLRWASAGDPPARRQVRELGNGPTDLALLASALQRAARSAGAQPVPGLL